jgi:hypothetical protein
LLFVKQHEIENIVANQGCESMKKNFENLWDHTCENIITNKSLWNHHQTHCESK